MADGFTVEEVSDLIRKEYGDYNKTSEAWEEDPWNSEEGNMEEQAEQHLSWQGNLDIIFPLGEALRNPSEETIHNLKSHISSESLDNEISPLGIGILKARLEKIDRNPHLEELYQELLLSERLLATGDEVFKEALTSIKPDFRATERAREPHSYVSYKGKEYGLYLLGKIRVTADAEKFRDHFLLQYQQRMDRVLDDLSKESTLVLFPFSTGLCAKGIKHLKEKGIDGFSPKYGDATYLRFSKGEDVYTIDVFYQSGLFSIERSENDLERLGQELLKSGFGVQNVPFEELPEHLLKEMPVEGAGYRDAMEGLEKIYNPVEI